MKDQPDLFSQEIKCDESGCTLTVPANILAHTSDPSTSKEAAENSEKFRSTHYAKILAALKDCNMGKDRISQATGLEPIQVSRRCSDLLRLGKIKRTGEKEKSKSWMNECVYCLSVNKI